MMTFQRQQQERSHRQPTSSPSLQPLGTGQQHQQVAQAVIPLRTDATKVYFKLIQAIHHAEIISNSLEQNSFPKGMVQKIHKMTAFIKPASPNSTVFQQVKENTDSWIHNNFLILREHYDQVISSNLLQLPSFQMEAYNKALKWARARYGRKLTVSSVDMLRSMIMIPNQSDSQLPAQGFISKEEDFPPLMTPTGTLNGVFKPQLKSDPSGTQMLDGTSVFPALTTKTLGQEEYHSTFPKPQRLPRGNNRKDFLEKTANTLPVVKQQTITTQVHLEQETLHTVRVGESIFQQKDQLSLTRDLEPVMVRKDSSGAATSSPPSCWGNVSSGEHLIQCDPSSPTQPNKFPVNSPRNNEQFYSNVVVNLADSITLLSPSQSSPQPGFSPTTSPEFSEIKIATEDQHQEVNRSNTNIRVNSPEIPQIDMGPPHCSEQMLDESRAVGSSTLQNSGDWITVQNLCINTAQLEMKNENLNSNVMLIDMNSHISEQTPADLGDHMLEVPQQTSQANLITLGCLSPANPMRKVNIIADEGSPKVYSPARSEDDFDLQGTPQLNLSPKCVPKRHPNTTRKIKDWSLKVTKPIVIVGDSNLSRIPPFDNAEVQIDSFPGAGIHHIYGILKKLTPVRTVREVILSIGLNNCLKRLLPTTTDKQLALLITLAKQTFPNARIRIPVINYSDRLERDQQELIELLNKTILKKFNFLTEINKLHFRVGAKDPIHWTPETARRILTHWLDQLNL